MMKQDEIIEMARQSELGFLLGDNWMLHHELEYFAKLVAQHEREKFCAMLRQVHDSYSLSSDQGQLKNRGQA